MNCEICGTPLKSKEYWKTKCYSCYKKTELKGAKPISEVMRDLGETTVSGKKNWKQELKN